MNLLKILFLILVASFTSSCQKELTYSFLLQHPNELEDAYVHCQRAHSADSCEMIDRVMRDYLVLLNAQTQDPEGFGLKILKAQQNLVRLQKNYEEAKKGSDQNNLQLAKQAYVDQKEQLQMYYAVASKMVAE